MHNFPNIMHQFPESKTKGRLTNGAVGSDVSVKPLIDATTEAVKVVK